ncbi:MAG: hypothetical protein NZ516_10310 [Raineya sp.]|nr:hypothetical protein [Raineya sp.]
MSKAIQAIEPIRVDKNIAHNSYDFKLYGEDETLIRNLVIYICYSYQMHIIEYGTLDPYDFCKVMNYKSRSYLFRKHPNPAQLKGLTQEEIQKLYGSGEYVWDSYFENALYRLSTEPMKLSYSGKTFDGKVIHEITSILILEQVQVIIDEKNGYKRYYKFRASDKFLNNLSRYFAKINLEAFNALRKSGLQNLYLFLTNLKENVLFKKVEAARVNFDLLCNLAEIGASENKQRKKYLIQALQKINKVCKLNFELLWEKNGKFAYQPVLKFDLSEVKSKQDRVKEMAITFDNALLHLLVKIYNQVCSNDLELESFREWFNDKNKNRTEKAWAYVKVQYEVFGRSLDINSTEVQNFVNTGTYNLSYFVEKEDINS